MEEIGFGVADGLNAFMREVTRETAERQAGAVDGGFANGAFEVAAIGDEPHLQGRAVLFKKLFNGDVRQYFSQSHVKFRAQVNFPGFGIIGQKLRTAGHQNLTFVNNVTAIN